MKPERFFCEYLKQIPFGEELAEIMSAALSAVDAEKVVRENLKFNDDAIFIDGREFKLNQNSRLFVVGAGKAAASMAKAASEIFGDKISAGFVITKDNHASEKAAGKIEICEAAHPVPDARNVAAAQMLKNLVSELTADDLVLVLISGGGSALTSLPVKGVSLADLRILTNQLLASGASINEINCLRKHLTELAGGKLALAAQPARVVSLVISDVVGSPLDVIASGMTAPDASTFADALNVLERFRLIEKTPRSILEHLQKGARGEIRETPKNGEKFWQNVANFIIADNRRAAEAALQKAREFGFDAEILTCFLEGEAREVGRVFAGISREYANKNLAKPFLLIAGGETTVTIRGDGRGGRNQELGLGAVRSFAGIENALLITLATDGGDGNSDAAGAVVDGNTFQKASALGLKPEDFLGRNDSYNFFAPLGAVLKPGATLTNVNDLLFLLIAPKT